METGYIVAIIFLAYYTISAIIDSIVERMKENVDKKLEDLRKEIEDLKKYLQD